MSISITTSNHHSIAWGQTLHLFLFTFSILPSKEKSFWYPSLDDQKVETKLWQGEKTFFHPGSCTVHPVNVFCLFAATSQELLTSWCVTDGPAAKLRIDQDFSSFQFLFPFYARLDRTFYLFISIFQFISFILPQTPVCFFVVVVLWFLLYFHWS